MERVIRYVYEPMSERERSKFEGFLLDDNCPLSKRDKAICILLLYTGMRQINVSNLMLVDIKWNRDLIIFKQTKTSKSQIIPLRPVVGNAILEYVQVERPQSDLPDNIVGPLTKDEMKLLLHAPGTATETGVKYSMMLSLLYSTATRISEVLSLKISDVHINEHKPYILVLGKGKRYRRSPLYQQDVKMLRKYILRFHGTNPDPNAYLFYSKCKGKYEKCTTRSVNKQLDIYVARVRQEHNDFPEHVHSHQFRHSMATHLIDDGVNVFNVSKILGHQSVATTMKYIGITPKMTEKAISQIESTSLRGISAKWKGNAKLEDLIK